MRLTITGLLAMLLMVSSAQLAMAQRDARDAADRGQRLDLDALRNDMLQRQLKVPEQPLVSAPAEPAKPAATKKRKKTEKKS